MRATSSIPSVATTDTDEGTRSPCRLKLTTKANSPSGVTCAVAGNMPSVTWPSGTIVGGRQSPQRAVGLAVREGHEVRLPVGRDGQAVRPVDVVGHEPDGNRAIDGEARAGQTSDG